MEESFHSFDISEESIIYCLLFVPREGCMHLLQSCWRSRYLTEDGIEISYFVLLNVALMVIILIMSLLFIIIIIIHCLYNFEVNISWIKDNQESFL